MELIELHDHRMQNQVRQSKWTMRRTYEVGGIRIRVTLSHDPYAFQRDYYAEVFNPTELKWNRVHTESDDWGDGFDILFLDNPSYPVKPEQRENIEILFKHMATIAAQLVEGASA